jgi:hypothetical protein
MVRSAFLAILIATSATPAADRIRIRLDTSESEAVLAILDRREAGKAAHEGDWRRLFATRPYRRLAQREAGMGRPFDDRDFRRFVLADSMVRRAHELRRTLEQWRSRDLGAAARRARAYLPERARIHAEVYPVLKPRTNSFVYQAATDAAIFLYLDPSQSAAEFENTVAHELHHIGFASLGDSSGARLAGLSPEARSAVEWMSAFGERLAMLAAAGGPDAHPHATSRPEVRARWDRDVGHFDRDLAVLDTFFLDVIDGRIRGDDVAERAFTFFGEQGPWYTVGWRMAVTIERRYGRAALIECMLDPRRLLARYNAAVSDAPAGGVPPALWSSRLLESIGAR